MDSCHEILNIMNNKIKLIAAIILLTFINSCSTFNQVKNKEKIKILNIDSNSLELHHAIRASFRNEEVLIVSKKLNQYAECEYKISEGEEYFVKLEREKQIQVNENLSFKVNGQGLYIEEKRFLKENEKVFSSPSLIGLCLEIEPPPLAPPLKNRGN